ncbi:hypothetical protein C8245_13850 [Paracidovorax avenae]|uniref:hypothetical protein n=1 Tax=Paracidovorax avenae TaxID=80867 RepID=UPI000D225A85|nr:hypothetical protein [Paracidovorax avenae]AVS66618.1 hypothetical protein C8245_13850 [Paracidovorax avenae]
MAIVMRDTSLAQAQELSAEHEHWKTPACAEACAHGWPSGRDLLCHCPALVARFGLQRAGVMRSNHHACGALTHFTQPPSYSIN